MSERHHAADHLGEECPSCGTVHRAIESIPSRPLTHDDVKGFRESDGITFARGIAWMSGSLFGYDTDEELTEDIVLSTESSSKLLSHYSESGWVVEIESEHMEDNDPEEVGEDMWVEASQRLSGAMDAALGGEFNE